MGSASEETFKPERIFKKPGFAETLYLGTAGGRRIIRKLSKPDALPFSRTALVREIRLLSDLPEPLKPFYPELIRTNLPNRGEGTTGLPDIIWYDMPYYAPEDGWATLSDLFLAGTIGRDNAHRVLAEIAEVSFTAFRLDAREPDGDYAERTMLAAIRDSLAWAVVRDEFSALMEIRGMRVNGIPVPGIVDLSDRFIDSIETRELLTPGRDRFLHGDFFPENILYNTRTGRWLLMDPVSVRGVHRGDFMLDVYKMEQWLSGELPALRNGAFSMSISGNEVSLDIYTGEGNLANLRSLELIDAWHNLMRSPSFADIFAEEPGWEEHRAFIAAFYAFCMLPLADMRQAQVRYVLALKAMGEFEGMVSNL